MKINTLINTDFDLLREPKDDASIIFTNNHKAISYARSCGLLSDTIICKSCKSMCIFSYYKSHINEVSYRCINISCRKHHSITNSLYIDTPTIKMCTYFRTIFKWIDNSTEKNVLTNTCISKLSYQKIKQNIYLFIDDIYSSISDIKLGSSNLSVQIDETAICHGNLPDCPSNLNDDFPGITWLVAIIEQSSGRFKFEIVSDRTLNTFKNLLERHINPGTLVITDGHASYPGAVQYISGIHKVVNHSIGFKNEEGFHTNNIENLWSLIKYEIGKRK